MKKLLNEDWPMYLIFLAVIIVILVKIARDNQKADYLTFKDAPPEHWTAPSLYLDNLVKGEQREMIIYGQDLVANTSKYFGPQGSVNAISNGMNCQNCHLNAGTKPWANNYGAVASTYPRFRERSGAIENIPKRVNDCFERSLNGKPIDSTGYEMRSIVAYMQWLGQNVKKGEKPKGSGITDLKYLDRAADPVKGQIVYTKNCQSCHGSNGEGLKGINDISYSNPPLWGEHSYNIGAGLYRLSRFAGFIKDNMPLYQAEHSSPVLSDEEAWDVAAFVNSQIRPKVDFQSDWPNVSDKPVDYPFGPYTDGFTEEQHKYGPFQPIVDKRKEMKNMQQALSVKNK